MLPTDRNPDLRLGLNERRLSYLLHAATAGSVRAAADKLGIEPSVVSRQIQRLERELGAPLLERHGRGVTPTEAGSIVLAYCAQKHSSEDQMLSQIEELKGMQRGDVHVAASEGFIPQIIETVLHDFSLQYPNIRIGLESTSVADVVERVANDRAHIGLGFAPPLHNNVQIFARKRHPICVICQPNHPLTVIGRPITFADLLAFPFALVPPEFGTGHVTQQAEHSEGLLLQPMVTTNSLSALKHYVLAGVGLTLLAKIAVQSEVDRGELVALKVSNQVFETTEARMLVRTNRPHSRATEILLDRFRQMAWF